MIVISEIEVEDYIVFVLFCGGEERDVRNDWDSGV